MGRQLGIYHHLFFIFLAHLIAARFFMTLALIFCVLSAVLSIVGLLQHRYHWLFAATGMYAAQGMSVYLIYYPNMESLTESMKTDLLLTLSLSSAVLAFKAGMWPGRI